jgi:ATP synthase protein I
MPTKMKPTNIKKQESFSEKIAEKEKRKMKALSEDKQSVWSGLGTFGMVGWSVAVPALLGAALGIWLDKKYAQSFSWTLTCLITGLVAGCAIAWNWVAKEDKKMHEDNEG